MRILSKPFSLVGHFWNFGGVDEGLDVAAKERWAHLAWISKDAGDQGAPRTFPGQLT